MSRRTRPFDRFVHSLAAGVGALSLAASATAGETPLPQPALGAADLFGYSVAIDGDVLVVGTPGSDAPAANCGAVHVYERAAGAWTLAATLHATTPSAFASFGTDVAVAGSTIAVGAPAVETAWLFEKVGGAWVAAGSVAASDGVPGDAFGASVALDAGGSRLVVGAPFGDESAFNPDTGAAYVFDRSGATWTQSAKLVESFTGQQGDQFGLEVDVSGDRIIGGAPTAFQGGNSRGRASIFERVGGTWSLAATLDATDMLFPDQLEYGTAVAIDGDIAAVSSPYGGPVKGYYVPGMVDVYERKPGGWTRAIRLAPSGGGIFEVDVGFGVSVALDADTLVVGSRDSGVHGDGRGAAFVFERQQGLWTQTAVLFDANSSPLDSFASDVGLSDGTIAIGIPFGDDQAANSGGAVAWTIDTVCCPAMVGAPAYVSAFDPGDAQTLHLDCGPAHAGHFALVLGSVSGTSPGLTIAGHFLPLAVDPYFTYTLGAPAAGPLVPGLVHLDAQGRGSLGFFVPPLPSDLANMLLGVTIHHAALVLAPTGKLKLATDAVPLTFSG